MNIIKELCIRQGLTQKEIAIMVGVSQPTVSDWFNNKNDPSGPRLEKLSQILGVSRAAILGYDDIPRPAPAARQPEAPQYPPLTSETKRRVYAAVEKMTEEQCRAFLTLLEQKEPK